MLSIEFSPEEGQVLINLLDVACKASGLQGAEACIHFVKKVKDAMQPPISAPADDTKVSVLTPKGK